jgi:hypothetical protein
MKKFLNILNMSSIEHWLIKCGYVLCGVAILYILYLFCRKKRIVIAKGEDGAILLAKSALREMVASIAKDLGIPKKVNTKIKCSHGKVSIDVIIRTGSWQNLSEISSALRRRLFDALVNRIGLAVIRKINVIVVGFRCQRNIYSGECNSVQSDGETSDDCCYNGENGQSEE